MYKYLKVIYLLIFVSVEAQDPRKRYFSPKVLDAFELNSNDDEGWPCGAGPCLKRSSGQDELGPFWANRGKRHPTYIQEPLFAKEPYWVLMAKDDKEPFFTSRGKKDTRLFTSSLKSRDRREFQEDVDSPFFAARGKKLKAKK